jgi:RNA polymerase sigma-70 factor (sigma-E family)
MGFEEFARARLPALLRYATLLTGDRELARDLVQEVLTRALVHWRRISAVDEPYGYVRVMVTNQFLSWRRRRQFHTVALRPEEHLGPLASDRSAATGDRDEMWRQLAGLPRQQRAVLVLRYYEDLPDAEIAEILGCRPGTVRAYAARALAALRIELTATRTAEFAFPPERKPQ